MNEDNAIIPGRSEAASQLTVPQVVATTGASGSERPTPAPASAGGAEKPEGGVARAIKLAIMAAAAAASAIVSYNAGMELFS